LVLFSVRDLYRSLAQAKELKAISRIQ